MAKTVREYAKKRKTYRMTSCAVTVPTNTPLRDDERVHHAEVAPDAAIDADGEERDHLRRQHDRQRPREHRRSSS